MKTIIKSVLLTAILALVVTGCQKEDVDQNVSLKSLTSFVGGFYESNWQSGNANFECAQAGGCDAGSYKMDHGIASGITYSENAVTVIGTSEKSFSWTSTKPVCKIIVKAGTGAYIFEIGGLKSGTMTYPVIGGVKAKNISHITFCYSPNPMVIAFKTQTTNHPAWTVVAGYDLKTVDFYSFVNGFNGKIYQDGDINQPFGNINVSDSNADGLLEVTIDNSDMPALFFEYESHLFVGTLADYLNCASPYDYNYHKTLGFGVHPSTITYNLPF